MNICGESSETEFLSNFVDVVSGQGLRVSKLLLY